MTPIPVDMPLPPGVKVSIEPRPGLRATVHIDGWNHSFHAAPMTLTVDLALHLANRLLIDELENAGIDVSTHGLHGSIPDDIRQRIIDAVPDDQVGEVMTAMLVARLDPLLERQRVIAENAILTGILEPLPWPVPRPSDLAVGHLMMARGQVVVLMQDHGDEHGALRAVQKALFDALTRQGNEIVEDDLVADVDDRDESCWCDDLGPWFEFDVDVGKATLAGSVLTLHDTAIPETVIVTLEGRRLGDIVATRVPYLDDLTILDFHGDAKCLTLSLDDEWDLLRDQPGFEDIL